MSFEEWAANDAAIDALITEQTPPEAFELIEPPALRRLAWALTIVTGALEAALAAAFLAPLGTALSRARDALLLAFLFTTSASPPCRASGGSSSRSASRSAKGSARERARRTSRRSRSSRCTARCPGPTG